MWLLQQNIYDEMQSARSAGFNFTAEQVTQFTAASSHAEIMTTAGSSAEIHVKGVLTNTPDIFAAWFGGGNTTYPAIIAALAEADADDAISEIILRFDSGGGSISGMFDAIAAIQTTKTPTRAIVGTMAASAAYGLASVCGSIEAHNRASTVGSVGIVIDTYIDPDAISITSTHAPDKRPDLTTAEGKATLVAQLDAVHELFAEAIANGRGTTVDTVNADYGRGASLLADEALKRGMIDRVGAKALHSDKKADLNTATGAGQQEASTMDLNTLRANHPDVYAQAVKIGQDEERDRVSAHLTMGEASGDMSTATKAIEDGHGMTASLQAKYMAAGMNKQSIAARAEDNPADVGAEEAPADKGADADAKASADILAAAFEKCGAEMVA